RAAMSTVIWSLAMRVSCMAPLRRLHSGAAHPSRSRAFGEPARRAAVNKSSMRRAARLRIPPDVEPFHQALRIAGCHQLVGIVEEHEDIARPAVLRRPGDEMTVGGGA